MATSTVIMLLLIGDSYVLILFCVPYLLKDPNNSFISENRDI